MEISKVRAYPVEVEIRPYSEERGLSPYVAGYSGYNDTVDRTLIRITTETGIDGWGEMFTVLPKEKMKSYIEDDIGDQLVGSSISDINSFVESFSFHGYFDTRAFKGGIEMAMWDCLGQHLDVPVHKLLGGKIRDEVEFSYAIGIQSVEDSVEAAKRAYEDGFRTLKTKVGGYDVDTDPKTLDYERSIRSDVNRLVEIDNAVGNDMTLRADANQSLSIEQTIRLDHELIHSGVLLDYLEQPLPKGRIGAYQRIKDRLQTPIAVNEDLYFPDQFYNLLREDAVDAGVADIVAAGGFILTRRLAANAESAGISLSHHSGFDMGIKTAATLHLVSATPAFNLKPGTTYYSHENRILESPFEFDGPYLEVPTDPGLGVSVDLDLVREHSI